MASHALRTAPRSLVPVPSGANPMRIIVIEEQPIVRIGLLSVLSAEHDMMVLGATADVNSALEMIDRWSPDAVLVDADLSGDDGPPTILRLLRRLPQARIVMLGQHGGDEEIHRLLEAGACGYLFKNAPAAEIVAAIREAGAGRSCVSALARQRLHERRRWPELTPRERQVLALVAEGRCNATIAAILGITHGTVKLHVRSILAKLGVEDRSQAALVALRRGFARLIPVL